MRYLLAALLAVVALALVATPATADWEPNADPPWESTNHKMHFPQLPDPNGWDVAFYAEELWDDPVLKLSGGEDTRGLADDWQCSQDGPVNDIHFWVSMPMHGADDNPPGVVPFNITSVIVGIYGNILPGPSPDNPYDFSRPDYNALNPWWFFEGAEVDVRWAGQGQQGWYDPLTGIADPEDHLNYYQVNITDIQGKLDDWEEPFYQTKDEIYWLELDVEAEDSSGNMVELGWKTANSELYPDPWKEQKHFMDDAIYLRSSWYQDWNSEDFVYDEWIEELWIDGFSRDLAFVITPEPGTVAMLVGAGLMGLAAYARRRRKP